MNNRSSKTGPGKSAATLNILGKWKAGIQTDTWTGGGLQAPYTKTAQMPLPGWEFLADGRLVMKDGDNLKTASFKLLTNEAVILTFGTVKDTMAIIQSGAGRILLKEQKRFANGQVLVESLELSKLNTL